jgi:small subunit ribosomal protein S20
VANIKSQKARVITNEKARLRNQATKSALRTHIKNVTAAIEKKEDTNDLVKVAQSKIGTAQAKGRIHKNTAARRTSQLMKLANAKSTSKK